MYMVRALATVLSIWSLHVILLSKMTPRYFTLFTNGIFLAFSCYTHMGTLNFLGE
jgi:hypothetical protein